MDKSDKKTVALDMTGAKKDAAAFAKQEASFVVIAGANAGMMHKLPKSGELFIGRTPDAALRIDHEDVSRLHARLYITPTQITLTDLGSTNGTYVNGSKIAQHVLRDGDKVQIGPVTILKFQYHDALDESFQRSLFDSAVKDGPTGLYNKKYFLDRIETDFAYAKRRKTALTLLLFDIDHFKNINDSYGHPTGDHVLKQLATLVKRTVRAEDLLARFGGEEFVVLMRDVDDKKALMLAERIRQLVEHAVFEFEGKRIPVTISVGIGTMSPNQDPPIGNSADLVNQADQYLYKAKNAGRNRVAGKSVQDG
jgi:two-component system, cell cycle response regulator